MKIVSSLESENVSIDQRGIDASAWSYGAIGAGLLPSADMAFTPAAELDPPQNEKERRDDGEPGLDPLLGRPAPREHRGEADAEEGERQEVLVKERARKDAEDDPVSARGPLEVPERPRRARGT